MKLGSVFFSIVLLTAYSTAHADDILSPNDVKFFETKIRPVLAKYCYQCHSARTKKPKGDMLLDTKFGIRKGGETGHAVVPGNLKESLLLDAIKHTGEVSEMPPKKKLPDSVIADFEKWVKMGAPDPRISDKVGPRKIDMVEGRKFWAFNSPKITAAPKVQNNNWPRTEIDKYLLAKLEAKGLSPTRDGDKETILRRATFDLTGLPPKPAEIDSFLKDTSPNAFEKVIDRLLSSNQFGERWGRHWLDVVRYAESTGKERNYPYKYAWRYRNYVIDSFNTDKPYDQFIREQLAGDLLEAKDAHQKDQQLIATGFLAIGPKSLNERNRLKFEMEVVDDQIDVTGRAILATTIACARCHDHKFDPIPTTDYYAMAGIFRSTQVMSGVRGRRGRNGNTMGSINLTAGNDGKKYAAYSAKLKKLQQTLNRDGRRLLTLSNQGNKKRKRNNKRQLQRLIAQMKIPAIRKNDTPQVKKLKQDLSKTITLIKRLQKNAPAAPAVAMGVQERGRVIDSQVFIKGEPDDLGAVAKRRFLSVTDRGEDPILPSDKSGRLELSKWLTAKSNPLTARVFVNRVWHHLFGTGIIKTVDNFGVTGEFPQHPELLDYLAIRFMENDWSVKKLVKSMMLSRAYQLSSQHLEANYNVDPENRLLWRGGRRRLDAEAIRDSMLAISGKLNLARPKSSPLQNVGQGELGRQINISSILSQGNIRSIYLPVLRQAMPEMMLIFDVADPSLVVGQRDITTVPTQALFMMNSPFVMKNAADMAKRLLDMKDIDHVARVQYAYKLAFSREPTKREQERVSKFISNFRNTPGKRVEAGSTRELEAWTAFCQTMFSSAEFRYLY